jgi:hypothetical protein
MFKIGAMSNTNCEWYPIMTEQLEMELYIPLPNVCVL